nr:MAG: hypothetical protein [Lake Baikal virophage 13]
MDRLEALLNGRKLQVRDPVSKEQVNHATERARLNNADRFFNQRIYDSEVKQANLYNQSSMPNTAKDLNIGFKINVYVIRLSQLLGFKGDLDKMLTNFFAVGVSIQKLRGTTREAQTATDFFKKSEILATYNELMLYIKTFAQEIINDDAFKAQIFNSSFNPLTQLLGDTANLYPAFFDKLPPPEVSQGVEKADQRKIYETIREQSIGCYSLFNTMANFINNMIFRPIVKDDVELYIKDNSVKQIFTQNSLNPPAVLPIPAPLQPQPQVPDPNAPPAPQAPVLFDATPANLRQAVEAYSAQLNPPRYLFSVESAANPNTDLDGVYQSIPDKDPATPAEFFKKKIGQAIQIIRAEVKQAHPAEAFPKQAVQSPTNVLISQQLYADDNQQQGQPAPPAPQPQPPQPQPPAPQPAPAPQQQAGPSLRDVALGETLQSGDPITTIGDVWTAMNGDQTATDMGLDANGAGDLRAVVRDTLIVVRQIEDQRGSILRAKVPADIDAVLAGEAQATMVNLDRILPDAPDKRRLIQEIINGMRDVRIGYRNIKAQDDGRPDYQQNREERTLYGLGHAERNNNIAMNSIFDFENMARRKAQHTDIPTITEITPKMSGYEEQLANMITKLNMDRRLEPSSFGKGKTEYRQGVVQRAIGMPNIMEYDAKAEALKKGKIMSGGCDLTGSMRGGMNNVEWNYAGYGEVMDEENTPFKRMIGGMNNPFVPAFAPVSGGDFMPYDSRFSDEEDDDYYNEIISGEGNHYADMEKPVDMDENADTIRKNNENYKVYTGKMKNVKYRN